MSFRHAVQWMYLRRERESVKNIITGKERHICYINIYCLKFYYFRLNCGQCCYEEDGETWCIMTTEHKNYVRERMDDYEWFDESSSYLVYG